MEVDAPLVGRAAAVGAGFAFAVSLGEFGATSFIARPDSPTLPIAIFRLLAVPARSLVGAGHGPGGGADGAHHARRRSSSSGSGPAGVGDF